MLITDAQLREADVAFRRAQQLVNELREARNELIRQALAEGRKVDDLAAVLGLTKGRISQLRRR